MIKTIIKRDGTEATFDEGKITRAVYKAMLSVKIGTMKDAEEVAKAAVKEVAKITQKPTVEQIQDKVETALMTYTANKQSFVEVAKAYILYRERRRIIRDEKASIGVKDDLKLSINAVKVLEARYLLKDEEGKIIETPRQMFRRVASHVGVIDALYEYRNYQMSGKLPENGRKISALSRTQIEVLKRGFDELAKEGQLKGTFDDFTNFIYTQPTTFEDAINEYEEIMLNLEYVPNSPTMMNAGARLGQLSACFVLPVDDSVDSIFSALKYTAEIHKSGGGTGFSFSRLRGKDDIVGSTKGVASGPVSFMRIFDTTTDVIKQGGKRRGANMGILRYDHPDIMDFILSKDAENTILSNFNISVGMTDEFFEKLDADGYVELRNPRDGRVTGRIKASTMWDTIISQAWKTADPGLIFLDEINRKNPVAHISEIEATNPCITGDTFVYTANGIRKARDLYLEAEPIDVITDSRNSKRKVQHASNMIMTGVKPVLNLRTREGFRIRLTSDHLVYSDERGWVKACNLNVGEKIRIMNNGGGFGEEGSLEEGRALGWLAGVHINKGEEKAVLSYYDTEKRIVLPFAECVNGVIRKMPNNHDYGVAAVDADGLNLSSVASERLREYAMQVGTEENELHVPDYVMTGNMEMQKGFIQALFEVDGTVFATANSRYSIRLISISEEMLHEVQSLLLNFGIYSRIYRNRRKAVVRELPDSHRKAYERQAYHELSLGRESILKFARDIGFISHNKNDRLKEITEAYVRSPHREKWTAEVESMEGDGVEEVFDLIEPFTHSFIANGIVVHNCGEQPLMPYESCNLGSINLAKFVKEGDIDYERLRKVIRLSTKFLDNVVDANKFPVMQIKEMTRKTRKIGLGVMGFADMLIKLGIPYNSGDALVMGERIMAFLQDESHEESRIMAEERGVFPGWYGSKWEEQEIKMRNSTTTTIAPTGTISIIAGCSSSIEPLFAIAFVRHVLNGQELIEVNPMFEEMLRSRNLYSEELMREVAKSGNLHDIDLDPEIKRLFVTAHEIEPEWHVLMQATFQRYCDSGVSKTINLPVDASPDDIGKAYRMAKDLHCKGITVYRDQSKTKQVLYTGTATRKEPEEKVEKKAEKKKAEKKETEEESFMELISKVPDKYLKLDSTFDPACPTGKCDK